MRAQMRAYDSSAMQPKRVRRESIANNRAATSLCSNHIVIAPTVLRLQKRTDGSRSI